MAKEKVDKEKEELRTQLARALADYANLSRRVEEEKKTVIKFANVVLVAKFLEVLDALEAAQKIIQSEGLAFVIEKFRAVIASEGIKEIPTLGQKFDPHKHEAIDTTAGNEDGKIGEVIEKGYELDGKVIRPVRVKVTKKSQGKDNG
ncbi:MAG: nucleotide exchange factor GrpE [Candidatus Woykebacteria bacterium RIFCSPHIGHO2_12_FULL_45_10]|uniref:Protein GrpE n=1 Tax=Candidatus Woykebacteria bacterium RIFCSPHIGHO2_12_FULL_45_10 TaxID=1802603 RepID=A0A1G1WS80_9BACT|nr:MAG: nucleotide exchange factor GrpE [Candidatus Woykebacteria bacterium RIFCSPHIGHO2_12_FULL_45_10]